MKIEIRVEDIENIGNHIEGLSGLGFEKENIKLLISPKDFDKVSRYLNCDKSKIEAGTGKLRIKGCKVEMEAR